MCHRGRTQRWAGGEGARGGGHDHLQLRELLEVDGEVGAEDRLDDERAQLAPLGEREVLEDVELGRRSAAHEKRRRWKERWERRWGERDGCRGDEAGAER